MDARPDQSIRTEPTVRGRNPNDHTSRENLIANGAPDPNAARVGYVATPVSGGTQLVVEGLASYREPGPELAQLGAQPDVKAG